MSSERTILVTGGTGTLGVPTVSRLEAAGFRVRTLSRRTGPTLATGDLTTGAGVPEAVVGADAILHLATTRGAKDVAASRILLDAAANAGVPHLVYISIVGIDAFPRGYYKTKLEVENLVAASTVPSTILRATQFHELFDGVFSAQRLSPVVFAPSFTVQPISVEDVADRLVELVSDRPAGRVPDIGGPEDRTVKSLAEAWKRASGGRRPIWPLKVPGKTFARYAAGRNRVPGPPYGHRTFEDYLAERAGGAA